MSTGLAVLALGLEILAPFRPGVIVLPHGREFGRRHDGGRHGVVEPLRRHHDGQARIGAVAQHGAVLRLDEELDADLAPELGDQGQAVDDEAALAVRLDDDLQFAAVRQQADAGAVALRQADLVEQARGLGGVVARR